ncbi:MAG: putative nuclease-like protein [Prokaryotic dsDNA virus sp.]|nr:MAG: putative nuclease-like protein [Prokaryotic dsDNA virus sp.]|tara:strand:- start:89 stop:457 length:369 start_codon:yes stop_codon:yes gene_type:complete
MYTYNIKLLRVIDGDTIDAQIDLGFDVSVKKRIRFLGVNTPESRTRDLEEKARGLAAKDRVKQLLEGTNTIRLVSHGVGKYGRCLGELSIDVLDGKECLTMISINELLIKEGHAVEYHGGKR